MCFSKSVSHPILPRLTCVAEWLPSACNQAFIGSPGANEASHWMDYEEHPEVAQNQIMSLKL